MDRQGVEERVRELVAAELGVSAGELAPDVSLTDELAADSLDLVELALGLEEEFGIVVPERVLDQVRTYGELVGAVRLLTREAHRAETRTAATPALVWARIEAAADRRTGTVERVGPLTPYTVETITEDALRAGPGARLDVRLAASAEDGVVRLRDRLAWVGRRGVEVKVRREAEAAGRRPRLAARRRSGIGSGTEQARSVSEW